MQARRVVIDVTELYEGLSDTDRQRLETTGVGQAVAEGLQLAQYAYEKYKKSSVEKKPYKGVEQVTVIDVAPRLKKLRSGAQRGEVLAQAVHYARDLVNEPALDLTPRALADHARTLNRIPGMTVKIMTEAQMKKLGMGAILSVSAGSEEPAYFVHLRYTPPQSARTKLKKLAICGKGITYDSGGLSIKPSNYMDTMKMDMAGAAIILALFSKLPRLGLQGVELHGVFAATENMPSGKATRPGDVVTAYNGTTIEINNTDAEGRLILADTLAWTIKTIKPAAVIDVATLTGAAIVALGQEVAPVMGTDQTLIDEVLAASQRSGEAVCQFPLLQEYMPLLNSDIADVQNSPKTIWAGSIIGGLFLQKFVGDTPWLHMDIAGPAWVEKQLLSYAPLGASGFGVRLLWEWLASHSKRP
jgi:leucyl aminopeptidase